MTNGTHAHLDVSTPAVVIDRSILTANIATMSEVLPGARLRPHVKAHKTTELARLQQAAGHTSFTCATPREAVGLARAGVGHDILVANESIDVNRLRAIAEYADIITIAVDSAETIDAAAHAGVRNVIVDVNVGMPRCGCTVDDAGRIADHARSRGMNVRGVMGYEGHLMMVADSSDRLTRVRAAMDELARASRDVGGSIVSAGGTGTFNMYDGTAVTEVQAGSYALMDTHYASLNLPFRQSMWVVGTVISVSSKWCVIDVGLKSLGMDHGNPTVDGYTVWFCSDEHTTVSPVEGETLPKVGDQLRVTPAHIDPTMAMHPRAIVIENDEIVDEWAIDLRGW